MYTYIVSYVYAYRYASQLEMVLGDDPNGWVMLKRQDRPRLLHAMDVHCRVRQALFLKVFFWAGDLLTWVCLEVGMCPQTTTSICENDDKPLDFGFQPYFRHSPLFSLSLLSLNVIFFLPRKGLLIMKRKPIAKNYVHTWLAFDVTVVLIDWALASAMIIISH